jgi:hypothetical protein
MSIVWLLSIWTASSSSLSISTYWPFFQLIAAAFLVALDHITGLGVDHLLLEPVASFPVDQVKAGFLGCGRGRIE